MDSLPGNTPVKDVALTSSGQLTEPMADSLADSKLLNSSMDRRSFFRKLAVLSAAAVIPVGCSSGGDGSAPAIDVSDISTDTSSSSELSRLAFANNINTTLSVTHDTIGVVDLQLANVNDEMVIPEADQFALSLTGPSSPVLEEKTYQVYNQNIGYFDLYIQPADAGNGQQNYMAIFSLLNS